MSCYAQITGSERVWIYYDTSGSVTPADMASLKAAIVTARADLVAAGIDPANIVEVDSSNEQYLQWFRQTADDYVVIAFINESNPSYHGETEDTGPTSAWTNDYNALKAHLATRRMRAFIYGLEGAIPGSEAPTAAFNLQHVPRAVHGTHGYPSGADRLWALGVRYRTNVPAGQPASLYTRDVLDFLTGWIGGGFCERLTSNLSEDAGSIFQATQALAVEAGISESYPLGVTLQPGRLHPFREYLRPDETAHRYWPIPTRNLEAQATFQGETILGRMARTYPRPVMTRIADVPSIPGDSATPQQVINHLFQEWAGEFGWFQYAPVPDLRLLVPAAVGNERQHYIDNPNDGVVTVEAIAIPQEDGNRRSMRDILDEWLGIFPGTIVRQTSDGLLELVPRVGPDAPPIALALSYRDLIGMSEGEDDPSGVVNRARVESRGYEFMDEQVVAPPAYALFRHSLQESVLEGEEVIPLTRQRLGLRELLEFEELTQPTPVEVSVSVTAFGSHSPTSASSFSVEGSTDATLMLSPGQSRTVTLSHSSRAVSITTRFTITRSQDGASVSISRTEGIPDYAYNPFGRTYLAYLVTLDVLGTAWLQSNKTVTGEFGFNAGDFVPGVDGGNAISESVSQWGEREALIRSTQVQLTPEQAQAVAESYVLFNINPRTVREVQQSEWNRYPVAFDHIGRYVDLPNGERAVVENRTYADAFTVGGGALTSGFQAVVTENLIDTSTAWLHLDNGNYFQLDDGSMLEAS